MKESTEKKFRASLRHKKYWVRKLRVLRSIAPFDYMVLTRTKNYAIEVKEWKKDDFYVDHRIKPHQIAGLQNWENMGARFKSYVFIRVICGVDLAYLLPLDKIIGRKSFKAYDFCTEFEQYLCPEIRGKYLLKL